MPTPPTYRCAHCSQVYVYEPLKEAAIWGVAAVATALVWVATQQWALVIYIGMAPSLGAVYSAAKYFWRLCPKCYRPASR